MKVRKFRFLALALAVLLLVAAGCSGGGSGGSKSGGGTVKFALIGPMTGAGAVMGQQLAGGAKIAIEDWVEEKGGLNGDKVDVEVFDDQGVANQALLAAERIAADPTFLGIVGHVNSGCTLAALPTYNAAKMIQISNTNTNVMLPYHGYDFFRVIPDENFITGELARMAIEGVGIKRACLAYDNTDWGVGSRDVLVDLLDTVWAGRLEILDEATFDPNLDKDMTAILTRFMGTDADAIIVIAEYTAGSIFLTQKANLGYDVTFFGCNSLLNEEVLKLAGSAAEGMYTFNPYYSQGSESERNFNERYLKFTNGNENAGEWAAHAHDAMLAWLKFFERHGSNDATYDEIVSGLKAMPEFKGVTGPIKFDKDGNVEPKPLSYVVVKDGQFVPFTW